MKMKKEKNNPSRQTKETVTKLFKSLKMIMISTFNKKLFFLPVILMLLIFSCKKENKLVTSADEQQNVQNAQKETSVSCGTTDYLNQQILSDPSLKSRMNTIEQGIQSHLSGKISQESVASVITIPVVIHVVYNTAEQNISDAQVLSQIDVLNEDYNKANADRINTPAAFQPYAASANVKFVLAKRDPNGKATNGITRTATANTSFSTNNYVKFNSYGGHDAWPTGQYLNIWVCNLGLCGYASYPGSTVSVDGVVVKYNCFGRTGVLQTSYNKGRTATHEVAHWLNVHHIWGDGTCADDLVGDTPTQEKANFDYPVYPHVSSCNTTPGDMFMNYMDYSADGARNMMTLGQVNRMTATLNGPRVSLLSSLGAVDPSGTTTTTTTVATCNVPSGLYSTLITANGATLKWSSTGAASYSVRYKSTTSTTWNTVSTTSTSFAISGLSSSTNYEFQVASVCSSTSLSAFSSSSMFITGATTTIVAACNIPGGLNATQINKNSATLNWYSTGAASYNVRYKATTSSTWITVSSASLSLGINGLSSSTIYEFQVSSVCSGTSSSAYSTSAFFTTSSPRKLRVA